MKIGARAVPAAPEHRLLYASRRWMRCLFVASLGFLPALGAWAGGGVPAAFHEPRPGLYTGGVPDADALAAFSGLGVGTVIDLRGADERARSDTQATSESLGMRYDTLVIDGADDLTPENAERLRHLLDEADGKVLLHCASGNRVGALLALMAYREEGLSRRWALALGRAAGLKSLEPDVDKRLRR